MQIIPAILAHNERELEKKLAALPCEAESAHIDFTNSSIFPSKTSRSDLEVRERSDLYKTYVSGVLFLEAHLMLPHPQEYIAELVKAGFIRIVIQIEAFAEKRHRVFESHQHSVSGGEAEKFAEIIHEWKHAVEVVPSLEIETPLSVIDSFAHELQSVQLMGIAHIGAQGRPFDERVIPRAVALRKKYPHLTISIDGGVNKENEKQLVAAGAERLIVGSAVKEFYG